MALAAARHRRARDRPPGDRAGARRRRQAAVGVGEGARRIADAPGDRPPGRRRRHGRRSTAALRAALDDVRAVVADWEAMRDKMLRDRRRARHPPHAGRRTPAGARRRTSCAGPPTTTSPSSATANTRSPHGQRRSAGRRRRQRPGPAARQGPPGAAAPADRPGRADLPQPGATLDALILTKTNARSTVHRPGYMDYIGVLAFDAKRPRRSREQRFLGLYTSSAYNRRPWDIPLVRQRHESVMQQSGPGPEQPQRQGAAPHPGNAAARRAVPVQRRRAVPHRMGILGLQERVRTPPVPAPRPLRPLLLRAGLHPARPLQHRDPPHASKRC